MAHTSGRVSLIRTPMWLKHIHIINMSSPNLYFILYHWLVPIHLNALLSHLASSLSPPLPTQQRRWLRPLLSLIYLSSPTSRAFNSQRGQDVVVFAEFSRSGSPRSHKRVRSREHHLWERREGAHWEHHGRQECCFLGAACQWFTDFSTKCVSIT